MSAPIRVLDLRSVWGTGGGPEKTILLGAAVIPNLVPAWIHHALFYATVLAQGLALWTEGRVLGAHEKLLADVDQRLTPATLEPVPHAG